MIEVNQRVIVEQLNMRTAAKNAPRYKWATVTKVGRKYFEVSFPGFPRNTKFSLEDLYEVTDYSAHYRVHLSAQVIYEEVTASIAHNQLVRLFNGFTSRPNDYTPGQLMSACAALGIQEQVQAALTPEINQLQEDLSDDT